MGTHIILDLPPLRLIHRQPYTVQRICELITCPPGAAGSHYHDFEKFLYALERSCFVTSPAKDAALLGAQMDMS